MLLHNVWWDMEGVDNCAELGMGDRKRGWTHPALGRVVLRDDSRGVGQGQASALGADVG